MEGACTKAYPHTTHALRARQKYRRHHSDALVKFLPGRCRFVNLVQLSQASNGYPGVIPLKLCSSMSICGPSTVSQTKQTPIRAVRPSSPVSDVCVAYPSKLQGDVAGTFTARMITGRMHGGKLESKTSEERCGHDKVLQVTPTTIVPSTDASAPTLKRRTSDLTRMAESICG